MIALHITVTKKTRINVRSILLEYQKYLDRILYHILTMLMNDSSGINVNEFVFLIFFLHGSFYIMSITKSNPASLQL